MRHRSTPAPHGTRRHTPDGFCSSPQTGHFTARVKDLQAERQPLMGLVGSGLVYPSPLGKRYQSGFRSDPKSIIERSLRRIIAWKELALSGITRSPAIVFDRRTTRLWSIRSMSRHRSCFTSQPRIVVFNASTSARYAVSHPGFDWAIDNRRSFSCGCKARPMSLRSGKCGTSPSTKCHRFALFRMRRNIPISMFTVVFDRPLSLRCLT